MTVTLNNELNMLKIEDKQSHKSQKTDNKTIVAKHENCDLKDLNKSEQAVDMFGISCISSFDNSVLRELNENNHNYELNTSDGVHDDNIIYKSSALSRSPRKVKRSTSAKKALLVAIGNDPGAGLLNGQTKTGVTSPFNDIKLMREILKKYGYGDGDITVLSNESKVNNKNNDPLPTKENIISAMTSLVAPENSEGVTSLCFYYSGHIIESENNTNDQSMLCLKTDKPYPTKYEALNDKNPDFLTVDKIYTILVVNLRSNVKLTAIIDSCNCPNNLNLLYEYNIKENSVNLNTKRKTEKSAAVQSSRNSKNIISISASGKNQQARVLTVKQTGVRYSDFTYYLKQSVDTLKEPTYIEILEYIQNNVAAKRGDLAGFVQLASENKIDLRSTKFDL